MPNMPERQSQKLQTQTHPAQKLQSQKPQTWADDIEAMCKRLSDARATVIDDLFACVSESRRAEIAMHCFARDDLKESAYEIARTCQRGHLHAAGDAMGEVLYALSRSA